MNKLVSVDKETWRELKQNSLKTGIPISKQIKFKVFGQPTKIKKVGDF